MGQVFFPQVEALLPASPPHPPNTEYRVAIGVEEWGSGPDERPTVLKVQMVYNGVPNGRRVPSYPMGTDDEERVRAAIDRVKEAYRTKVMQSLGQ